MEEEKKIEIEGKKYTYIPPSPKKQSKSITMLIGMAMMFSPEPPVTSNRSKVIGVTINEIVDEYKLILQKKSKLSRSQREAVIWKFKRHFKEID